MKGVDLLSDFKIDKASWQLVKLGELNLKYFVGGVFLNRRIILCSNIKEIYKPILGSDFRQPVGVCVQKVLLHVCTECCNIHIVKL